MTSRVARLILALLLGSLLLAGQAQAAEVRLVPGPILQGSAAAVVVQGLSASAQPTADFQARPLLFILSGQRFLGFFGVPLATKPGGHEVVVKLPGGDPQVIPVKVQARQAGSRRLQVDEGQVRLSPADRERTQRETLLIKAALATRSPERLWRGPFLQPVPGEAISPFGRQSIFNGRPAAAPHRGVDLRAAEGQPVLAPARGRVILAGRHFFAGGSVYLDHGQGLISMSFHLSRIEVESGQAVERGDRLGLAGATGRVTGSHLHYGLALSGVLVDPLSFQALTERLKP